MSWGFFNIFWCDTFPDNSFSASRKLLHLVTLASCECRTNVCIYFHSYFCCQHIIFVISPNLICLLHNVFNLLGEKKSYLSFFYSLCLFSIKGLIFPFLISTSTYFIWYLIYNTSLVLITLCRSDFIQAGILFPFPHSQPNEMQNDWAYYAEISYEQTLLLCFHKVFAFSKLVISNFFSPLGFIWFVVWWFFFLCFRTSRFTKLSTFSVLNLFWVSIFFYLLHHYRISW